MRVPYASAADAYFAAGFSPLPAHNKTLLVTGVSGYAGMATIEQIRRWVDEYASNNIVLRLPKDVVALDVDAYKGDLERLALLEQALGKLPTSWNADSRGGAGGKVLYRVNLPEAKWKSAIGGITTVQHTHRYVLAPPSVNAEVGHQVEWYDGLGGAQIPDEIPTVAELPTLPEVWCMALLQHQELRISPQVTNFGQDLDVFDNAEPCQFMTDLEHSCEEALVAAYDGGLHDTGLSVIGKVLHAATRGHSGVSTVLAHLGKVFIHAGRIRDLSSEWESMFQYALAHVDIEEIEPIDHCLIKLILPNPKPKTRNQSNFDRLRNVGLSVRQVARILERL